MAWVYDGLRLFRQLFSHSRFLINIEDLFYWMSVMLILFQLIFTWHHGEIRSYIVIGILGGAFFYLKWISPVYLAVADFVLRPLNWMIKALERLLRKMKVKTSDKH